MASSAGIAEDLNNTAALWAVISIGDLIQVEADVEEEGVTLLKHSKKYTVLSKVDSNGESHFDAFVVESELPGRLVYLSPAFVADYTSRDRPPILS